MTRAWLRGALLVAGLSAAASACQDGFVLAVVNECRVPVEVIANESPEIPSGLRYKPVPAGEAVYVGTASEFLETMYVWVRPVGTADVGRLVAVPKDDLVEPADHSADLAMVLRGAGCPSS